MISVSPKRWSVLHAPTLRQAPAGAEAPGHRLLVRAGFIRQLHSGHYSLLPLGLRVHKKVEQIVRRHMEAIGAQEFLLPAMQPASIWQRSGRLDVMGPEMFRLQDRRGIELVLGMTHEEIFTILAAEISSYRELPQIWYQVQTKFRDEPRAKSGLLRVREFTMKDSYSFDIDEAGLDVAFDLHRAAYVDIFAHLRLGAFPVEASSGTMGGGGSVEFMVPSPAGEDDVARCASCGYAANIERATSMLAAVKDKAGPALPERFASPGIRTIEQLAAFDEAATPQRQIKTLVVVLDKQLTLALVRGDHQLNEQKMLDATGATDIRAATAEEMQAALGALPGSLGAVGVDDIPIMADLALKGRTDMVTGANEDDWHYRGVDVGRDVTVERWIDLRAVAPGEPCPTCGRDLDVVRCIEVGHIFKLGRKYSEPLEARVQDEQGRPQALVMGSYGLGIGRAMAAIAETHHDDRGLLWPVTTAPFEAVVTIVDMAHQESVTVAETIAAALAVAGVDILLDDRLARPGVKFADAELVGFPFRVTVGPRGIGDGRVELTRRASNITETVPIDDVVDLLGQELATRRSRPA
jgi:prolyl-tRNA synthetase